MKKLVFLLMVLSFNVHAANLIDTIGAQCAEILLSLNVYDYPENYDMIKKRNSQLWALQKCLKVYKENGGDLEKLNERYHKAYIIYKINWKKCLKDKEMEKQKCAPVYILEFKQNVADDPYPNIKNIPQELRQ